MSIKSDNWIRRMAREHGLIEPFEPEQVRANATGRVISYGTSSYGYDVRCAPEFKIFTNINSTIVDPKQFDEKSFVDLTADVCIIPPNSFALARTVEYFRIPRNVLTVCLGKCVTGDTRVVDADTGAYVPITEMRWGKSTLALDGWKLKRAKVSAFMPQGKKEVFELRTRAGMRIRATANHPFRLLNGWVALGDLRIGDRIAVARNIPVFGSTAISDWEASLLGLMISEVQRDTPGHGPVFTLTDPMLVRLLETSVASSGMGEVAFKGRSSYRLVNRRGRGAIPEANRAHRWLENYGLNVGAGEEFVPQSVFMAPELSVRLFLQALFAGDGCLYIGGEAAHLEYYSKSRRLIEDIRHLLLRFGIFSLIRETTTATGTRACSIQITQKAQMQRFAQRIGFVPESVKQRQLETEVLPMIFAKARRRSSLDTLPRETRAMLGVAARIGDVSLNALDMHPSDRSVPMSAAVKVARRTGDRHIDPLINGPVWDVVEHIESAGVEEVYDISVPGLHNFVANDLVVHNSTYARCFSANTRVALVDGSAPTLEQMARRHESGEQFWGYSLAEGGRVIVSLLDMPRFIGRDSLIEITLDNGEPVQATPDHVFFRRDGRTALAHELRPGDSLMPLYRDLRRGCEYVYQPINGHLLATHRLADEWNIRRGIYGERPGTHRRRGAARQLDCDRSLARRFPEVIAGFQGAPGRNHKITAVRELPGEHDVYCLRVPEAGNFGLEAGVFVHNCGIICNVTPLEPEWEGHVTLEFSNTTPLPAKIYANEGVAQMLFFESDEVCATSYADRGGKYQGQKGVTLPKA